MSFFVSVFSVVMNKAELLGAALPMNNGENANATERCRDIRSLITFIFN